MSAGGVFKLIANDGKPDRLLVATALLNQRFKDVMCSRRAAGKDPTPTLLDVEKTHVLHINAHFKPFAALGYEYNKVRAQSGTTTLGSTIQFSIPQFGDFFHDMVVRVVLSETYNDLLTVPTAGAADNSGPYNADSSYPESDEDWNGAGVLTGAQYAFVDAFGTVLTDATDRYRNMVRYVEFPAERLFSSVKFDVNGNPLDEYNYRVANMMRKFCISDEKLHGYKRLVGQEVEIEGVSGPCVCRIEDAHFSTTAPAAATANHGANAGAYFGSSLNQGLTPAAYYLQSRHAGAELQPAQWQFEPTNLTQDGQVLQTVGTAAATGSTAAMGAAAITGGSGPNGAQYGHVQRAKLQAFDGPQTPKYWQPPLEVWNRLWFWFNLDARLSVPSVAIPFGQRFISIDLAAGDDIVRDFPGGFVRQTVTNQIDFSLDLDIVEAEVTATADESNGSTTRNFRPYWQTSTLTAPTISTIEMYINNIFVNPEVHDLFIRRVGFSLIRVFRLHTATSSASSESLALLSQLKWPIECLFVGFQPQFNTNKTTNMNYHKDWHRMGKTFDSVCGLRQSAIVDIGLAGNDATIATAQHISNIGQIVDDTYTIERPTVTTISVTAHGIQIHDVFPQAFFNAYEPFHFGGEAIRPPKDAGAMMINFALFTGCYQPSGYLNTSRARELYVHWTTSYVSNSTAVTLIAVGIAINFLLVTDGSAVLRYST